MSKRKNCIGQSKLLNRSSDLRDKLDWLKTNQSNNIVALNAIESKLGLPLTPMPPKREKSVIDGHQLAKENKWLKGFRSYIPGHGPNRFP